MREGTKENFLIFLTQGKARDKRIHLHEENKRDGREKEEENEGVGKRKGEKEEVTR